MMHICVSKLTIIGSDNGLLPVRRQAIIWTNVATLLIRTIGTDVSEILIEIHRISLQKMHLKIVFWEVVAILSLPQCVNSFRQMAS